MLSHAGIKKRNHSLTWFGDLSYSKLKLEDLEKELHKCPYCNEELVELYLVGSYTHKPPDLDCEILIDTDDYCEVKYQTLENQYDEIRYDFHWNARTNNIIEQIA
jgi:hypothetical protein